MDKFARFIFLNFAKTAMKNPKAYMELLFWKNTKEAVELTEGYEYDHTNDKKKSRGVWTETEENELRELFMEHQTGKYSQGKFYTLRCIFFPLLLKFLF